MENRLPPEIQEIFEDHLLGKMSVKEALEFEKKLGADPELQSHFEEFKALFTAVEEAGLRQRLDQFHQALEPHIKDSGFRANRRYWIIAASVALLLGIGILQFMNRGSFGERLFEQHFRPDPGLPTVMGKNDNYAFYEGMVDYKQGHYEVAIEKWEHQLKEKPKNDTLTYFLGSAYLAKGETDKSIDYLQNLKTDTTSVFHKDGLTYLGLAHLKRNETEKAKETLSQAGTPRAKTILSNLK